MNFKCGSIDLIRFYLGSCINVYIIIYEIHTKYLQSNYTQKATENVVSVNGMRTKQDKPVLIIILGIIQITSNSSS